MRIIDSTANHSIIQEYIIFCHFISRGRPQRRRNGTIIISHHKPFLAWHWYRQHSIIMATCLVAFQHYRHYNINILLSFSTIIIEFVYKIVTLLWDHIRYICTFVFCMLLQNALKLQWWWWEQITDFLLEAVLSLSVCPFILKK